jgi:hypothetical protein
MQLSHFSKSAVQVPSQNKFQQKKKSNNKSHYQNNGANNNKQAHLACSTMTSFSKNNPEQQPKKNKKNKNKKKTSLNEFLATKETEPAATTKAVAPLEDQQAKSEDFEKLCSICHNDLPTLPSELATTNCNHSFCYSCISQWTSNYLSSCPLCKTKVTVLKRVSEDGTVDEERIQQVSNLSVVDANELSQNEIYACLDHNYFLSYVYTAHVAFTNFAYAVRSLRCLR